ncbi:uncharacterized protein LOC110263744 [Arachis ipaensis]|uniref:uncharacterized protein LOC110263744 n=1 Tax=Arachis ipaensis TaxID=130454 RepID=UPI000A2B17A5|nr:uncharacterized protein LOC110263744 [Arachis ipaensis]
MALENCCCVVGVLAAGRPRCCRRKTLPVRVLNLVFIRLRFRKPYRFCMWVLVFIAGVRSPLPLEVAAGLLPNRFGDRRCFGSAVPSSFVLLWLLRKWLGADVLVAGDFELRRKGLNEAFGGMVLRFEIAFLVIK